MLPRNTAHESVEFDPLGPPRATQDFLRFAAQLGCLNEAYDILDIIQDPQRLDLLGAVTNFLQTPHVFKLAQTWGYSNQLIHNLGKLGEALFRSPEITRSFGSIDFSQKVKVRFKGDLSEHYLETTLAADEPHEDNSFDQWIQSIRLWLLWVSLLATNENHPRESHILAISRVVREVCDDIDLSNVEDVRKLSFDFVPGTIEGFENQLKNSIRKLLNSKHEISGAFRSLLEDQFPPIFSREWTFPTRSANAECIKIPRSLTGPQEPLAPDSQDSEASTDGPDDIEARVSSVRIGSTALRFVTPKKDSSFAEQEIEANGISILGREDSLFLPWSWHRLTSTESPLFHALLAELTEGDELEKLGGAMMRIAILTSKSARQVEKLAFSTSTHAAWTIHPTVFCLSRKAPRRPNGWDPDKSQISPTLATKLLNPRIDEWRLELPQKSINSLKEAFHKCKGPVTLGDIWSKLSPSITFETWINNKFKGALGTSRLTSPILGSLVRQEVFENSLDHLLARLVSSSPETALPAPCSYAAYSGGQVLNNFKTFAETYAQTMASGAPDHNWAGSQLEILEKQLEICISKLQERLKESSLEANELIKHHNLITAYTVISLLATTGGRPVNSPFETLRWFDTDQKLVFVDDKSGGTARGARLCLMTPEVADIFTKGYLPHLRNLSGTLRKCLPNFPSAIESVLHGDEDAKLPLFFFLSDKPNFEWFEVTETGLTNVCGADDWPLPFNLFRHRFSTLLRRKGLDPEIIDALMGHSDAEMETHGAYSLRVLADDLDKARPLIQDITAPLALAIPPTYAHLVNADFLISNDDIFRSTRRFGNKARSAMRRQHVENVRATARQDIHKKLNGRPPSSLSPDQWDEIALSMILREDKLPHSMGQVRYDEFQAFTRYIWKDTGKTPRLKRRFLFNREGTPCISELAIGAARTIDLVSVKFNEICASIGFSGLRPQMASALAALDACVVSKIADSSVLNSIACHSNIKLVELNDQFYIEHFQGAEWRDGMPLQRFTITKRCAAYLQIGLSSSKAINKLPKCPKQLEDLFEACNVSYDRDMGALLKALAKLTDQRNCIEYTGLQAAILAGRIKVSALPHHDFIRTSLGYAAQILEPDSPPKKEEEFKPTLIPIHSRNVRMTEDSKSLQVSCKRLFRKVRKSLEKSNKRESTWKADIQTALDSSPFIPGDLPFAIASWANYLVDRPAKTKSGKLKVSSALTYFSELASKVLAVGYADNLSELDEDEISDLYWKLLEAIPTGNNREKSGQEDLTGADQAAEDLNQIDDYEAVSAALGASSNDESKSVGVIDQLLDFHHWASDQYGLDDFDFSEFELHASAPVGRPGYVNKKEYLWSLRYLLNNAVSSTTQDLQLYTAFVIFLCFRFGLRVREALGLYRRDWIDVKSALVVLIQSNSLRGLKTLQSKRQIPRIESLEDIEVSIYTEVLRRWEARDGKNFDTPLLPTEPGDKFKYLSLQIRTCALKVLKQATLNPKTTIHQLRHSFGCRVIALLSGEAFQLGEDAQVSHADTQNARRLLLGHELTDRRLLWAACRLMGHSTPATTLRSYFHGQISPKLFQQISPTEEIPLINSGKVISLSKLQREEEYLKQCEPSTVALNANHKSNVFLEHKVNYLRLRGIGYEVHRAAWVSDLGLTQAEHLERYISEAVARLERSHKGDLPLVGVRDLCAKIGQHRWNQLLEISRRLDEPLKAFDDIANIEIIGRSRHLILFRPEHFNSVATFVNALALNKRDLYLLRSVHLGEKLTNALKESGLDRFIDSSSISKKNEQRINTVLAKITPYDDQLVTFFERVGVFVIDTGVFADAFEFLLLWLCWVSRNTATPHLGSSALRDTAVNLAH